MKHLIDVIITALNYSHDIATAFVVVSGLTIRTLSKRYPSSGDADVERYYIRLYTSITAVMRVALVWVLVTGLPRIMYYKDYESPELAGDLQGMAVVAIYAVIIGLFCSGLAAWYQLAKKIKVMKMKHTLS